MLYILAAVGVVASLAWLSALYVRRFGATMQLSLDSPLDADELADIIRRHDAYALSCGTPLPASDGMVRLRNEGGVIEYIPFELGADHPRGGGQWERLVRPDVRTPPRWGWSAWTVEPQENGDGSVLLLLTGGAASILGRLCYFGRMSCLAREGEAALARFLSEDDEPARPRDEPGGSGDGGGRTATERTPTFAPGAARNIHGHTPDASSGNAMSAFRRPRRQWMGTAEIEADQQRSNRIALSVVAFAIFVWMFGWAFALALVPVILLHEYGHVLAFRAFGKEGCTMMLTPLGGVATSATPNRTEFERAMTAVAGPAICAPLSLGLGLWLQQAEYSAIAVGAAFVLTVSAIMNLYNLLPAGSLDGAHVFKAIANTLAPQAAEYGALTLSFGIAAILVMNGHPFFAFIIVAGAAGTFEPVSLPTLKGREAAIVLAVTLTTIAMHVAGLWFASSGGWWMPLFD